MREYKISVLLRASEDAWDWSNHVVYSPNRKTAIEAITDYFCGTELVSVVFNNGIDWDND
jgi:hypothetical protein